MSAGNSPAMSVILATPDRYETIRQTMRHLRVQTAREQLEIVIVGPSVDELALEESELVGFAGFQVIAAGVAPLAEARARGIRAASAPVVVLCEDHSYPDPGWAAALIEAHRGPWAVVGPAVRNANPRSISSWAALFMGFCAWMEPVSAGVTTGVPSHNSAYKRDLLLEYGDQLAQMLEVESLLHHDLQAKGHQLYLEPAAHIYHTNISRFASSMRELFHSGRLFGSARARYHQWTPLRRLIYTGGSPLIPLIGCRRVIQQIRRTNRERQLLPWALPAVLAGLTAHSLGEMPGYALGAGDAAARKSEMETHRDRFLTERDRRAGAGR